MIATAPASAMPTDRGRSRSGRITGALSVWHIAMAAGIHACENVIFSGIG